MMRRAGAEKGERVARAAHRVRMASIFGVLGCPRKGPEVDDVEGFFFDALRRLSVEQLGAGIVNGQRGRPLDWVLPDA